MKLERLYGKRAVVETNNKKIFRGMVVDCLAEDENEGHQSIIVRSMRDNKLYELFEEEIKHISIMN